MEASRLVGEPFVQLVVVAVIAQLRDEHEIVRGNEGLDSRVVQLSDIWTGDALEETGDTAMWSSAGDDGG